MTEGNNNTRFFIKDFLVAGIAGSVSNTLMAPIFNIKLNIDNSMIEKTKENKLNLNYLSHTLELVKDQRIKRIWKGNGKVMLNAFWFQGISFSIKNFIQKYFNQNQLQNAFSTNFLTKIVSGSIGGSIALLALFPFNYPRVMLAQMKGLKDFYKNFSIHLIPTIIYRGLYFGTFDSIKQDKKINSLFQIFSLSLITTIMALIVACPFQTARFKILRQKQQKSLQLYFNILRKQSKTAIMQCLKFKFPFLYRTMIGALTLTLYQKLPSIYEAF